jgi:molecular chaperone GrpE (heat shock protein)
LFKKSSSLKERANTALSNLQRNAYAMSMLRTRLESRINYVLSQKQGRGDCQELTRVLELVKNGEMILYEISEKIESARFLEEFVTIMDSAASSVNDIRGDLEQMVPAAEAALEEMHEAIAKVSVGLTSEVGQEVDPRILAEVAAAIEASKAAAPVVEIVQHTKDNEEEEPEHVPA